MSEAIVVYFIVTICSYILSAVNPAIVISGLFYHDDSAPTAVETPALRTSSGFTARNGRGLSSRWI